MFSVMTVFFCFLKYMKKRSGRQSCSVVLLFFSKYNYRFSRKKFCNIINVSQYLNRTSISKEEMMIL